MASTFSFDIESEFDAAELDHAIDQSRRELANRYDFKGTSAKVDYTDDKKQSLTIEGDSEYQMDAIIDVVRSKLAKRNLSQKLLDVSQKRETAGMIQRQVVPFVRGLDQEKAKTITKLIRDSLPKIKTQIQGETIRVTSSSKDELQQAMKLVRAADLNFPTNFTNFR